MLVIDVFVAERMCFFVLQSPVICHQLRPIVGAGVEFADSSIQPHPVAVHS